MRALAVCASLVCFSLLTSPRTLVAEEPNDFFAQTTVLPTGTLSVSDTLYAGTGTTPNTLLGVFDAGGFDPFDNFLDDDDDSSTLGNGEASGLVDIGVNDNGTIRFIVTGSGDLFFDGDHEESGGYEAYVEVFNATESLIHAFSVTGSLQPEAWDEYTFDDSSWIDGSYSINIDNTINGYTGGDVDFFTFVDLEPGAQFSAETSSVGEIDTLLGQFNDSGTLLALDDNSGDGDWSLLTGTVPASGQLTFAVTGSDDASFQGEHAEQDAYDLQLTVAGAGLEADFDGDSDVDGMDLSHPTLGWQTRYDNNLTGADFLLWQQQFGSSAEIQANSQTVPEPSSGLLLLIAILANQWSRLSVRD